MHATKRILLLTAALAAFAAFAAAPAQAQIPLVAGDNPFVYEFARPGQQTMTVYIWGDVSRPGIWLVEPEVDLIALLSAALVPGVGDEQPEYRQHVELSVYRGEQSQRRRVYHERLEDLVAEGASYPVLQEGDIMEVTVQQERRFSFQAVAQYIGTASSLLLLYLRLRNLR